MLVSRPRNSASVRSLNLLILRCSIISHSHSSTLPHIITSLLSQYQVHVHDCEPYSGRIGSDRASWLIHLHLHLLIMFMPMPGCVMNDTSSSSSVLRGLLYFYIFHCIRHRPAPSSITSTYTKESESTSTSASSPTSMRVRAGRLTKYPHPLGGISIAIRIIANNSNKAGRADGPTRLTTMQLALTLLLL